jgi:hypothetical protein
MTNRLPEDAETTDRADAAVAQWRREMPELSEKLDAMLLLGRLSEASPLMITSWLEPEYARMGLKYGEFDVLATLCTVGTALQADTDRALPVHNGQLRRHDRTARQTAEGRPHRTLPAP